MPSRAPAPTVVSSSPTNAPANGALFTDTFNLADGAALSDAWAARLGGAQVLHNRASGKTLAFDGHEALDNPEFSTDTARWAGANGALVSRVDTQAELHTNNSGADTWALKVQRNGQSQQYAAQWDPRPYIPAGYNSRLQARVYSPSSNAEVNAAVLVSATGTDGNSVARVSSEDAWQQIICFPHTTGDTHEIDLQVSGAGNGDTCYFDALSFQASYVLYTCELRQPDIDLSAKLTMPAGGVVAGGIVARWSGSGDYWLLRATMGKTTQNLQLAKVQAYHETAVATTTLAWVPGATYTLRLVCSGTAYTAYVDGAQQLTYTDAGEFNKTATQFGLLWTDVTGMAWDDFAAYPASNGLDTAAQGWSAEEDAIPPALPAGTIALYCAPHGSASGDGSQLKPWDLPTGLARLAPGQTLVLLDGVYIAPNDTPLAFGRKPAAGRYSITAAPGARPIITCQDGTPPAIAVGDKTTVRYIWFGGTPDTSDVAAVPVGSDSVIEYCTFFGYFDCISDGEGVRNTFRYNRWVHRDPAVTVHYPMYITNNTMAPGETNLVSQNIIVGAVNWGVHLWWHPTNVTIQRNFFGQVRGAYVLDGSAGIVCDHNIVWSTTGLRMLIREGTACTNDYNIYGQNTVPGTNESGDHNVFVSGSPIPFGTNQSAWTANDVQSKLTVSVANLDAAVEMVKRSFSQTTQQIHDDPKINHYFMTIRKAINAWQ